MRGRIIAGCRRTLNWLTIKYTTVHAIQKYGPVAQPGRVPDFYHFGRNPAVSGSNPDGPVIKLVLLKDFRLEKQMSKALTTLSELLFELTKQTQMMK